MEFGSQIYVQNLALPLSWHVCDLLYSQVSSVVKCGSGFKELKVGGGDGWGGGVVMRGKWRQL